MKYLLLPLIAALSLCACTSANQPSDQDITQVRDYISSSWERTVRFNTEDHETRFGMPYPYTVPSPEGGIFQEIYYWDTYFTNEGLLRDGRVELAKGNVDDMLYLVERFGRMPNGSRETFLNRSQPPFLSLMVNSVFEATKDTLWLASAYKTLEKEYEFWMSRRLSPVGLNMYSGNDASQTSLDEMLAYCGPRLKEDYYSKGLSEEQLNKLSRDFVAECESGWDMNPRFDRRCGDFCPIDLNSLLYAYEMNFARFCRILGKDEGVAKSWEAAALKRKALIDELLYDPNKHQYYDYDYVRGRRSEVLSAAVFFPMFVGLSSKEQSKGVVKALKDLEFEYGIAACADEPYPYEYQWSYPNMWAPLAFVSVEALDRYGFRRDAHRIASKYVGLVVKSYKETGTLWEKYDVSKGVTSVGSEYDTPEMLGWSAGAFIVLSEYLMKTGSM